LVHLVQKKLRPAGREGIRRKAVDKNIGVGYEGGMTENTQAIDIVRDILAATFGPGTAAEVMKDDAVVFDASGSSPVGDDGAVGPADRPSWWRKNLDGSWRKKCQAPEVLKGVPQGETRQRETDLAVLKALHSGAETLVEVVASTGFVKVTCVRSLERLVLANRVLQSKAAPTGKRGRPAFTYRPTTEAAVPVDVFGVNAALALVTGQKTAPADVGADVAIGGEG